MTAVIPKLRARCVAVVFWLAQGLMSPSGLAAEPLKPATAIDIGSQRELFVDHHLIETLKGCALHLHEPRPAGVAIRFDRPWEGRFVGYVTVLKDGETYRMYYRGLPKAGADGSAIESTCYAESKDGVTWKRPDLGLYEIAGTRKNNVILKGHEPVSHNFSPFLDARPDVSTDARFKALGGGGGGLVPYASGDGVRWRRLSEKPVITKGAFDSQNVSFWSTSEKCYVCYFRTWDGYRTVSRTTSQDFLQWSEPVAMSYGDTQREHLYTNQTHPYFRAPHIYVAIAARFMPGRRVLSTAQARAIDVDPGYFGDCSDAIFMSSRGGNRYIRTFMESFLRPGVGSQNWVSRTNYPGLGVVPTGQHAMSFYVQKNYGQPTARLDRYELRTDGFISVRAPYRGGEMITKPLVFRPAPAAEVAARRRRFRAATRVAAVAKVTEGALAGKRSLRFDGSPAVLAIPGTQDLGKHVTLAARIGGVPKGHRRLFSAYDGGSTKPGELILDVHSGGAIDEGESVRFFFDGARVGAKFKAIGDWSAADGNEKPHHVAVTWDEGLVRLYFDGKEVAVGGKKTGAAIRLRRGDLLFGEDYPPTPRNNEPFAGLADDILVARRVLTAREIAKLATEGAGGVAAGKGAVLYTAEGDDVGVLRNHLSADGAPWIRLPRPPGDGLQELVLNVATSAAGEVRVELQDAKGKPLPGYRLEDCDEIIGDQVERVVTWQESPDVSELAGRPVRVRFVMKDADVYSMRFR